MKDSKLQIFISDENAPFCELSFPRAIIALTIQSLGFYWGDLSLQDKDNVTLRDKKEFPVDICSNGVFHPRNFKLMTYH